MRAEESILLKLRGRVQGVGFRPTAFRLAQELGLRGWVRNDADGAEVALAGPPDAIAAFRAELPKRLPAVAMIQQVEELPAPSDLPAGFVIRASSAQDGPCAAEVLPDLAMCADCLQEISDPRQRRFRYPFTNCTHCGPRFSILEALPYDRAHTTMRGFPMCADCAKEYGDPLDRRFHAQPIACPACGPQLEWTRATGPVLARRDDAMKYAVDALRSGYIVAVKGIGGFHLMVDARNGAAIRRLRQRKRRAEKPFAILFPNRESLWPSCQVSAEERVWLTSAAAPIVLLRWNSWATEIAPEAAPDLPWLGAMLPYSPLHHLLLRDFGFPVVATSGNLSDEPICTDNAEARSRLADVADFFLLHDRPIARPLDDSVLAVCADGGPLMIRRGRGLAPFSVPLPHAPDGWLGAGGQMKNAVALSVRGQAVCGPHIGDLDFAAGAALWERTIQDLANLHQVKIRGASVDLHPDYASTQLAARLDVPLETVQHHHAHVAACMVENELDGPVLGIAWDGTGLGSDGTIWGGEFLVCTRAEFRRSAWLRPFLLIGGDSAIREPRRSALGVLREMGIRDAPPGFTPDEVATLDAMQSANIQTIQTSSAGRLFDAVASMLDICHIASYEGQAAARIEALADLAPLTAPPPPYPFEWRGDALDWSPMMSEIWRREEPPAVAAARFHKTLAHMQLAAAERIGIRDICLTGGCFQNRRLLATTTRLLMARGFRVWRHTIVPPNDASLSLGQLAAAAARIRPHTRNVPEKCQKNRFQVFGEACKSAERMIE